MFCFLSKSINYLPTCIYPWIKLRKKQIINFPCKRAVLLLPWKGLLQTLRKEILFILNTLSTMRCYFLMVNFILMLVAVFFSKGNFFFTILKFFLKSLLVIIIHNLQQQKFLTILQYFSNCNQKIQISLSLRIVKIDAYQVCSSSGIKEKILPFFFHRSRRNLVVRKITLKSHDNHKSCEILYSQNF